MPRLCRSAQNPASDAFAAAALDHHLEHPPRVPRDDGVAGYEQLARLTALRSLRVVHYHSRSPPLAAALTKLTSLTQLQSTWRSLGAEPAETWASVLRALTGLRDLAWYFENSPDPAVVGALCATAAGRDGPPLARLELAVHGPGREAVDEELQREVCATGAAEAYAFESRLML